MFCKALLSFGCYTVWYKKGGIKKNLNMNSSLDAANGTSAAYSAYIPELAFIIPLTWGLLVIIGSVGNGLVIYTLGRNGETSPTNVYVINLALADLTYLIIVIPITTVAFAVEEWIFGDAMCKISNYMIYVSIQLSIN